MQDTYTERPSEDIVLNALYSAVSGELHWADVLRTLSAYFNASSAMLKLSDRRQCAHSFFVSSQLSDPVAKAYTDYWWRYDPWAKAAQKTLSFQQSKVARGSDLLAVRELKQTLFYKDFLLRILAEHLLLSTISDHGSADRLQSPPASFCFMRAPDCVDFSDADVKKLKQLTPHLHRAFKLHWQWRSSQAQLLVFQRSHNGLDFGVLFFDATGRMLSSNTVAKEIIADPEFGQYFLPLPHVMQIGSQLDHLVHATTRGKGGSLNLSGKTQRLLAFALPVAYPGRVVDKRKIARCAVMLMLVDPRKQPGAAIDFMVRSFKLSKAESRILPLLFDNHTPAEMADMLGLKISTIRSQLSSVYAKTGTTRQQELILLLGAAPPIRQADPVVPNRSVH
ncbi:helix-turn-helix transcriptional regulator [Undibacterium sp. Xuan67W]|uniref:helix-turn-helix transcriptional regulator n=1 Tax=Undibacterium sp. Xuan67W TaxID=3413057 RepID=UPI003BF05069